MSCKSKHNRTGCNLPVVHIKGGKCKSARGGTPTVRSPQYKLAVTGATSNADKPTDISTL